MIILDFGSGETCKNERNYIERMIDSLAAVDTHKEEVIIKWQLFSQVYYNGVRLNELSPLAFYHAWKYAQGHGYRTTASVFDMETLSYLAEYTVPFIKIANRTDLYRMIKEIHALGRRAVVSVGDTETFDSVAGEYEDTDLMCCVSEYPASIQQYERTFGDYLHFGISDHTDNFYLYYKYRPDFYEVHYKLDDSTGLDAGPFARTPEQLKEIL